MFTKMMVVLNAYLTSLKSEEGQGLAEYALIIVLVSLVVVLALTAVGGQIDTIFNDIKTALEGV